MEELVTRGDICDALERPGFIITHAPAKPAHRQTIVHVTRCGILRWWAGSPKRGSGDGAPSGNRQRYLYDEGSAVGDVVEGTARVTGNERARVCRRCLGEHRL